MCDFHYFCILGCFFIHLNIIRQVRQLSLEFLNRSTTMLTMALMVEDKVRNKKKSFIAPLFFQYWFTFCLYTSFLCTYELDYIIYLLLCYLCIVFFPFSIRPCIFWGNALENKYSHFNVFLLGYSPLTLSVYRGFATATHPPPLVVVR